MPKSKSPRLTKKQIATALGDWSPRLTTKERHIISSAMGRLSDTGQSKPLERAMLECRRISTDLEELHGRLFSLLHLLQSLDQDNGRDYTLPANPQTREIFAKYDVGQADPDVRGFWFAFEYALSLIFPKTPTKTNQLTQLTGPKCLRKQTQPDSTIGHPLSSADLPETNNTRKARKASRKRSK